MFRVVMVSAESSTSSVSTGVFAQTESAPLTAAEVDAADALIKTLNSNKNIQTAIAGAPEPNPFMQGIMQAIRDFFRTILEFLWKILEPLGPALPWVAGIVVFVLLVLLASPLVRALIRSRFEKLFQRDHLLPETPWRPTAEAAAALLDEIEALAAQGRYDEAVHLLLHRSVADLNAFRPDLVRKHFSARDISAHPLLPEDARPAFREITRWSEKSYFAGQPVGLEGYEACRQAYVDFVSQKDIGKGANKAGAPE
ncbi:MAG: hypothetical protein QM645_00025 [Asticcacaulis sp.]